MKDWIIAENIITVAAILTAVTVVSVFSGKIIKFFKKMVHFFDDFLGEEERPGVPARPGFSERMKKIEGCVGRVDDRLNDIESKIHWIELELKPNHGSSLRDAINRIEQRVDYVESRDPSMRTRSTDAKE